LPSAAAAARRGWTRCWHGVRDRDEPGGRATSSDFATIAYSAATGRQQWVSRYNGPANRFDSASAMAVSPGGGRVFVTGLSENRTTSYDYTTVAYRG